MSYECSDCRRDYLPAQRDEYFFKTKTRAAGASRPRLKAIYLEAASYPTPLSAKTSRQSHSLRTLGWCKPKDLVERARIA